MNYKLLIFGAIAGLAAITTGCSEDDTLDGAKEVYITLNPSAVTLCVGDTVSVSAAVTNLSGKTINTPVAWSVDDESVAEVILRPDSEIENDYVVVAKEGAQNKTTKLRATLTNGRYAVTTVTVTNHSGEGVIPAVETKRVYRPGIAEVTDTCWFTVQPFAIVKDFTPTFELKKIDGEAELHPTDKPVYIDEETGRVGVVYYCDRSYGTYNVILTVGGNGDTKSGSTEVVVGPGIKVGMWDKDTTLGMSAPSGNQSYGFNYEVRKTVNINTDVKVYARLMVEGGRPEDIANARGCYKWEVESGNSLLITGMDEEDNIYGYDCVLSLRSGITPGENVINFCSPDTLAPVMKAYITVLDFDKDFPVNDIVVTSETQDVNNLVVTSGANLELQVKTDPITSIAYHRPEVTVADPSILEFASYEGTLLVLRGKKPGKTKVTLTSMQVTKSIEVTVNEDVVGMDWTKGNDQLPVGQQDTYTVKVRTASGEAWTGAVKWTSSNSSVLTVSGNGENATVKAVAGGKATLTAEVTTAAGKTTKISREITVKDVEDIIVDATTLRDGDAGYYPDNAGRAAFYLYMPAVGHEDIWIYTADTRTNLNGNYSAADFDGAKIDGAAATVTASTLTVTGFDGSTATANGDITLSMNGTTFKVIFKGVTVNYDI